MKRQSKKPTLSAQENRYVAQRLGVLGLSSLGGYYLTAHWRALRGRLRKRRCEYCGRGGMMSLHHLTYARLGAELDEDMVTLCNACHRAAHGLPPLGRRPRKRRPKGKR